jgi:hypothetical protein
MLAVILFFFIQSVHRVAAKKRIIATQITADSGKKFSKIASVCQHYCVNLQSTTQKETNEPHSDYD